MTPCPPLLVFLFALTFTSVVQGDPATTEKPDPKTAWLETITRTPPGPFARIKPVSLTFDLGWKNKLKAGKMTVQIKESKQDDQLIYLGEAKGKTTGMARLLWPYDVQATSFVDHDSLRPRTFELREKEYNKINQYNIRFDSEKLVCDMKRTNKKKNKGLPVNTVYQFEHDFVQDILSSIFYVRSQPLEKGDKVTLMVAPFNKPYLAKFQVIGREKHRLRRKTHETIKLSVEISKIHHDLSLEAYTKVKKISLWITDDEYRFPLELQAEVFVGYVTASLTSRKWLK